MSEFVTEAGVPHFKVGQRKVYLFVSEMLIIFPIARTCSHTSWHYYKLIMNAYRRPDHKIALVRTPFLPPTFAKFIVPLHFNKLDMRDYMWHVYGVRALTVRSFVEQQRVRAIDPDADIPRRKWHRPPAIKKMTIEMDKPFVWPEEPSDYSEYV